MGWNDKSLGIILKGIKKVEPVAEVVKVVESEPPKDAEPEQPAVEPESGSDEVKE